MAVQRPTSARPGSRGIIHPDRTIEGWVGGSCAQPMVVREALRALADGQPRLLRLSRDAVSDSRRADGVLDLVMTCHSGGTLEIYVEPHLPRPALWVAGITPIASALVDLGAASGYDVTVLDPAASPEAFPGADRVLADTDLASLDPEAAPFIVVTSQGQWDEEALVGALRRDAPYVGLVASPRRAGAVRAWLRDAGVAEERIARLRAPAGLDLGAETAEEVALSILAELVAVRRRASPSRGRMDAAGEGAAPVSAPTTPGPTVGSATEAAPVDVDAGIVLRDPVCGMTVDRDDVRHIAEHGGVVYAFCCLPCRTRFVKDPVAFVPAASAAR